MIPFLGSNVRNLELRCLVARSEMGLTSVIELEDVDTEALCQA